MDRSRVLALYRATLRAGKLFPSIRRDAMLADIKLEYRDGRIERDPEKIEQRLLAAVRGLDQLQSYAGMKRTAGDWDLALRGPV